MHEPTQQKLHPMLIENVGCEGIPHPPYSHEVARSEWHLFLSLHIFSENNAVPSIKGTLE